MCFGSILLKGDEYLNIYFVLKNGLLNILYIYNSLHFLLLIFKLICCLFIFINSISFSFSYDIHCPWKRRSLVVHVVSSVNIPHIFFPWLFSTYLTDIFAQHILLHCLLLLAELEKDQI